jgi:CubicO group peptidase (beta-lactamase class C family)
MKNLYLNLIFCLLCFVSAKSRNKSSIQTSADALLKKYSTLNGPGCTIAIFKSDQLIYKNTCNLANLENNIPITTSSVFDVASLAKQFTGFAISLLIQ